MSGSNVMDEHSTTGVRPPVTTYSCRVCGDSWAGDFPYKNNGGGYCSQECARAGYIGTEIAYGLNEINETIARHRQT